MKQLLMKLWKDEEAPTAVEYGLMVALIAAVIVAAAALLGTNTRDTFKDVADKIKAPAS